MSIIFSVRPTRLSSSGLKRNLLGGLCRQFLAVVGPHKGFQKRHVEHPQLPLKTVFVILSEHELVTDILKSRSTLG